MLQILKIKLEIIWIVLLSNAKTRHVQLNIMKRQKNKNKSWRIRTNLSISRTVFKNHNICSILILTGLKTTLLQGRPNFSNGYTLNVFQVIPMSIGLHSMIQFALQKKVKFSLNQTPLQWPTSNTTKTVFV